jgi:hypothetical protein
LKAYDASRRVRLDPQNETGKLADKNKASPGKLINKEVLDKSSRHQKNTDPY